MGDSVEFVGLEEPHEGMMRAWFMPQIGRADKVFYVEVDDEAEANRINSLVADYDNFLVNSGLKAADSNTCGIEVFEDGEWVGVDQEDDLS